MPSTKAMIVIAVIALLAVAVAGRVEPIRKIVYGA